jgi:uncharacterized membrane protein
VTRSENARTREENAIEFSRIVAFSDGVFSIAITLLVLALEIPQDLKHGEVASELWGQRGQLLAYAISFAVIGRFWVVHHGFFSKVRAFDARLIALNILYLGFIVLIPFSTGVIGEYASTTAGVTLYAANVIGVVLIGQGMSHDAQRAGLTTIGERENLENWFRVGYIATVFLVSIAVSTVSAAAPYCWFLLFFDPAARLTERFSRSRSS